MVDNLLSLEMFMLSHTAQVCDTCHVALNLLLEIQGKPERGCVSSGNSPPRAARNLNNVTERGSRAAVGEACRAMNHM